MGDLFTLAPSLAQPVAPIDMILHCPACGLQHIDKDNSDEVRIKAAERGFVHGSRDWENFVEENEWENPPHRSHLCDGCGHIWRPADVPTNGVKAIKTKGEKDSVPPTEDLAAEVARLEAENKLLKEVEANLTELHNTTLQEWEKEKASTELLDWLDRNGALNFSYECAEIRVTIPDDFESAGSIREVLQAAKKFDEEPLGPGGQRA